MKKPLTISIDDDLRDVLDGTADRENRSLSNVVEMILQKEGKCLMATILTNEDNTLFQEAIEAYNIFHICPVIPYFYHRQEVPQIG